jgi:hypothetical protein
MSDGFGPRYTCPRATGVLAAPTGLYHVCAPEEWRVCNSLCRASKAATAAGREMRRESRRHEWALAWKRLILHLVPARHLTGN